MLVIMSMLSVLVLVSLISYRIGGHSGEKHARLANDRAICLEIQNIAVKSVEKLFREAEELEMQGLHGLANVLRQQAEEADAKAKKLIEHYKFDMAA